MPRMHTPAGLATLTLNARPGTYLPPSSNGFTPADIDGLYAWFKADNITASDGDAVTTWTDQSGAGNNVTQATGAAKPIYKTAQINGKPVVRFDGTDDELIGTATPSAATGITMAGVAKLTSAGNFPMLFVHASAFYELRFNAGTGQPQWNAAGAEATSAASVLNEFVVLVATFDDATNSSALYVNGTSVATAAPSSGAFTSLQGLYIGSRGSSLYFGGDVPELLAYDHSLSSEDRVALTSYLGTEYALTVA